MMGTKKLLNTSNSPPIAYKRYSNQKEEETSLQQQNSNHQQQQQYNENCRRNNKKNSTCLLQKQNTNKMFTKIKNYFTQIRTASTSALSATQKHCSQQQQKQRKRHLHQPYRHQKLTECNSIPIVQSANNMLNIISIVVTLVFLASINGAAANPVFVDNPSLAQFQSGRNIRHLPCIVRKSGRSGVCMFAIDCIKQNGTHLGTCIDRFYFGSCCDIKEQELTEIADNSIDQNTISHHFTSDSSTLPTSALFKVTTLSPPQQTENISRPASSSSSSNLTNNIDSTSSSNTNMVDQQDVTQILNSVTQSIINNSMNITKKPTSSSTTKPFIRFTTSTTTTTKPSPQTTHKQSHFVIRTTTKPTKYTSGAKPSHNTTIKKKTTPSATSKKPSTTTTTTTTKQPILTTTETTQEKGILPDPTTTPPTKLFTYQIVETTAYTPTEEATNMFDFVTTERTIQNPTQTPQASSSIITTTLPPKATTTKPKETTTSTTEAVTIHKITKPQTTRKPTTATTTTKKPTSAKRTTVKPTRRPITTTTTSSTTTTTTTSTTTKKPTDLKVASNHTTETQSLPTSTTSQTVKFNKTTLAPRPRPKPTASIVRVPKPTTTPTTFSAPTTTTELEKIVTTTNKSTNKPTTSTTQATTPTTTTSTTTTTTPKPTATATTTHKTTTHKPTLSSTTHKPGLVTWTNIDGEPIDPNQPVVSDWVPVTSQAPIIIHNKIEELSGENVTFEEMDVSVSSSVSAVMNNTTVIISAPQKPVHMPKPTTSTTTASSTKASSTTTSSTTTSTTTTTTTITPDISGTTLKPNASSSNTNEQLETSSTAETTSQFTTEGLSISTTSSPIGGFSTEEITTENLNLNSTTSSPITGLEGVDYRQVCGRRMFPEPRIVGGSNAAFGRWPWQISLRQWRTSTYLHKCGAALLNENWAITAAHCVDNVPPSDLLLRLGEYDLAEEEEPYGYQERRVQIVASHPQFDPRTFEYDLALLRFYEPVVFQPNIIPVCVPEMDEDFIGQTAFVTGWGRLYEDGPLPSVLQEVAVPVINNTICESMYRAAGYIEHIPHIFICAGWKKGGYDSCEGDSGGPMVLQRESDKRFQLGGVISWGIGCAEANQPGVYTRISEFRDWINQILQF